MGGIAIGIGKVRLSPTATDGLWTAGGSTSQHYRYRRCRYTVGLSPGHQNPRLHFLDHFSKAAQVFTTGLIMARLYLYALGATKRPRVHVLRRRWRRAIQLFSRCHLGSSTTPDHDSAFFRSAETLKLGLCRLRIASRPTAIDGYGS